MHSLERLLKNPTTRPGACTSLSASSMDIFSVGDIVSRPHLYLKFRYASGFGEGTLAAAVLKEENPVLSSPEAAPNGPFKGWNIKKNVHHSSNMRKAAKYLGSLFADTSHVPFMPKISCCSSSSAESPITAVTSAVGLTVGDEFVDGQISSSGVTAVDLEKCSSGSVSLEFVVEVPWFGTVIGSPDVLFHDTGATVHGGYTGYQSVAAGLNLFHGSVLTSEQLREWFCTAVCLSLAAGRPIPVYMSDLSRTLLKLSWFQGPRGHPIAAITRVSMGELKADCKKTFSSLADTTWFTRFLLDWITSTLPLAHRTIAIPINKLNQRPAAAAAKAAAAPKAPATPKAATAKAAAGDAATTRKRKAPAANAKAAAGTGEPVHDSKSAGAASGAAADISTTTAAAPATPSSKKVAASAKPASATTAAAVDATSKEALSAEDDIVQRKLQELAARQEPQAKKQRASKSSATALAETPTTSTAKSSTKKATDTVSSISTVASTSSQVTKPLVAAVPLEKYNPSSLDSYSSGSEGSSDGEEDEGSESDESSSGDESDSPTPSKASVAAPEPIAAIKRAK